MASIFLYGNNDDDDSTAKGNRGQDLFETSSNKNED